MPSNNDFFTPEEIDQQIEDLSHPFQPNHLHVHDRQHMRLIQHLRRFYRTNAEEDVHALNSAWERISHERLQAKLRINEKGHTNEMRSLTENNVFIAKKTKKTWRILGILAAVMLMTALVGTMIVIFNQAQQGKVGNSVKVAPPPKPVQDPQLNLYVSDGSFIYKVDSKTGKKDWTFNPQSSSTQRPLVADGVVYFASGDTAEQTYVYALNVSNGTLRWKSRYSSVSAIANNILYVTRDNADNIHIDLAALNAKTGNILWHYNPGLQADMATVSNGIVYGTGSVDMSSTGALYALDANKGTLLWNVHIQDQLFNVPQIVNNVVYATSSRDNKDVIPPVRSGYAYAFNSKTGAQLWRTAKIESYVIPDTPVISQGIMYFITNDVDNNTSSLYTLHTSNGMVIWNKFIDGEVDTTPLVTNDSVYMGVLTKPSGMQILALKAVDGSVRWSHTLTNSNTMFVSASPVAGPDVLYVSATNSKVLALNMSDGSPLHVYQIGPEKPAMFSIPLQIVLAP